jgi:hypothetical protein
VSFAIGSANPIPFLSFSALGSLPAGYNISHGLYGQLVSFAAKSADYPLGRRRYVGVMPEAFPPEHVGQVQLDHRLLGGGERIEDGD